MGTTDAASLFNGSSVSGEVTNNIDLPVNGIISQSVHWHVYYEARARFHVDGTNASTPRERKAIPPQTCPFTPVLHFHRFLHTFMYIFARSPFAKFEQSFGEERSMFHTVVESMYFARTNIRMKHVVNSERLRMHRCWFVRKNTSGIKHIWWKLWLSLNC